ncbi:hypothetical protein [Clostridium sp. Marseille-P3244]|uniref:hypothetical protein n=1 Tax=Clostridium sp. Marseille-P3244 TaxID=1871020 RepID=UPI00092FF510|nr:hypothetical protein [Clostridium sp. Marseille-P3244]
MDNDHPGFMTPFDELVTSPKLQIIKLLIPYAPASGRQVLASFVKFREFRETVRLFRGSGGVSAQAFGDSNSSTPLDILSSFRPYLNHREAAALDMVINLKEMMSVMEIMQDTNLSGENGMPFDPMEILSGMLTPEQREIFETCSDLFSQPADSEEKGDDTDERVDGQSGDKETGSGETGADQNGRFTDGR